MSSGRGRRRLLGGLAAGAVLAALVAGCGGSSVPGGGSGRPLTLQQEWDRVVLCARAHGMPGLPDPRIGADGKPIFPSGSLNIPPETQHACQALLDRLIPNAGNPAPTAAQMAALLRFARCMRAHGVWDWPDPSPDGEFAADYRLTHLLKSALINQIRACERFNPNPRGEIYFGHP
jgi:hypothetical protein